VLVACAIGLSLCGVQASAQVTWDANTTTSGPQDGSGTWSTSDANWWNGTTDVVWPNLTTSSAIIGANSGAAGTITASGSLTLNAITFNAPGSGSYTLTGGTLGFAGTSPAITANANATIESAITSGAGLTKSGTGTLTLSGVISNTSGGMSINRGAVTLTGTLTNTASGGFNIGGTNGGLLAITGGSMSTSWNNARAIVIAPGASQSGTIAISSGALSASGLLISEDAGGNGVFTQSGGTVSIGTGNLWLSGNTSSLTVSGGSFTNNNTTYFAVGSTNPSTSTISVSGSGSITLGTLRYGLSGRNGFTTTVNVGDGTGGGTLQVSSFVWSGATTVASTINFNSGTFVANGSITMPSQISTVVKAGGANLSVASTQTLTLGSPLTDGGGGGGLRKLGAGTLSLTGSNTYTGTTSLAAGSLSIGSAWALQNSTLDLAGADTGTVSAIGQNSTLGGLAGSRNLDMATRTLSIGNNSESTTYSGTLSNGALTKIGSGTFTLTGASSYTGATTIDAGVLQIGSSGTTGSISSSSAISGSAGAGLVFSRTDNYGGNVSNTIGGGVGLTLNSGTLVLTGSNAYAGATRINGGVLSLGAANALAGVGNVTFAGGTLQFTASNSGDYASRIKDSGSAIAIDTNGQNRTFAGSIDSSNTAGLVKSGGGTLVLSGSNSFSGGVTLTGGQVQIANANALGTGVFTTNVDAATPIAFNLPTSGTVANAITINKPGVNRTYDIYQNQANNVTLAGNLSIASGNSNIFRLGSGLTSGTFTLTGSNTFGSDVLSGANVTFRIGGTNAAGSSVWRPDVTAKMVLLDGANFRSVMGNAIASYSMEASGTATVSGDVFNRNTANVAVNLPAGAQLTFSGNIRAEGGSTTGAYTKTGAGTWVVNSTANQMTYNVLEGTMQVPTFGAIGPTSTASFLVLNGGTLRYTGAAASTTREFTLGANGGGLDASGSGTAAFTSTAAVSFTGSGNRTLTLTGTNTGNNTLAMAINDNGADVVSLSKTGAGTWVLSGSNSYTGATTISAGRMQAVSSAALSSNSAFTVSSGAFLGLNGANGSIGSLAGVGTIENGHATNASTLTIGSDGSSTTFAGLLRNGAAAALAVTKTGSGSLTLEGANTYSGATNVNAGVLRVNGSIGVGGITVASGATLMGSGTIGGLATIAGLHAPGNSPGVETFTNLTYNSGASVQWELWGNTATNSPLAYDQIVVSGDLTFSGVTTLDLVFTGSAGASNFSSVAWADPFWGTNQEWLLYDVANSTTGFAGNLTLATTNWQDSTGAFFQSVRPDSTFSLEQRGSDVYIVYAAV
ncbi:MAG: hypothetical protein RLZZ21_1821, partial [Planctomycetota bacterium]